MRKISKPLGWTPKETPSTNNGIVNKEEPAKKKRKTKEVEPEPVVETSAEEVATEPVVEPAAVVAPEADVEQAPEAPAEPAS